MNLDFCHFVIMSYGVLFTFVILSCCHAVCVSGVKINKIYNIIIIYNIYNSICNTFVILSYCHTGVCVCDTCIGRFSPLLGYRGIYDKMTLSQKGVSHA